MKPLLRPPWKRKTFRHQTGERHPRLCGQNPLAPENAQGRPVSAVSLMARSLPLSSSRAFHGPLCGSWLLF